MLTTLLRRELVDNCIIKPSYLKDPEAYSKAGLLVYNLYIKEKFDSKVFSKNKEAAVNTLREALESRQHNSLSIFREGNGFDKLPWSVMEKNS